MASRKTVLDGLLYGLNLLVATALLLSYLAYYIDPLTLSFFSFMALAYPLLLLVNGLFVIYWLIRLKRKIFVSLLCILVGYMHVGRTYQTGNTRKVTDKSERLKVMSFNTRLQNHYDWLEASNIPQRIYDLIKIEDPDVLLLQEYRSVWPEAPKNLGFPYVHTKLNSSGKYGSAIFSKYPIKASQIVDFEGDTIAHSQFHTADVEWNGQLIRLINLHLASVGLGDADYKLLENGEQEQEDIQQGLSSIVNALSKAFKRRSIQLQSAKKAVQDSPYPVILAGDFNDVPQSFAYHQIKLELEDSFLQGGHGFGKTYVRSPLPLRIDYIFHSADIRTLHFKVIEKELSDHYPIVSEFEFAN